LRVRACGRWTEAERSGDGLWLADAAECGPKDAGCLVEVEVGHAGHATRFASVTPFNDCDLDVAFGVTTMLVLDQSGGVTVNHTP